MLKYCWLSLLVALCALVLAGCSPNDAQVLHVYGWADYISPDLIAEFEKANNCRVQVDVFDSNEMMYSKLQAGGSGYDIIIPSHYFIGKMSKSNMIVKLDKSRLPNLKYVDAAIAAKLGPGVTDYAVPYFMGYTGLGYNKEIKDFKATWQVFQRADLKGYMTLLDDYSEVIGAAMLTLGMKTADLTGPDADANLQKVIELVRSWLPNVIKFENEQYKNGLSAGEFKVVMGYSSDLGQIVAEDGERLAFAMPVEGCLMSCDTMVISAKAPNPDLAYKFIDFLHQPENAAKNIQDVYAYCPNSEAVKLLPEEVQKDETIFIDPAIINRSEFVVELEPAQEAKFLDAWNKIKAGNK